MIEQIHQKALTATKNYKRCEIELIEILEQVDQNRVYLHYGYNSLFKYTTDALGLSEEVAYIFINVSRKTREIPALKAEIKSGAITVSKAKKISPVLTSENQSYWLNLAKTTTKYNLEKEVAGANPKMVVRERLSYVNAESSVGEQIKIINVKEVPEKACAGLKVPQEKSRVQLQVGVSENLMLKLRKAQDILSQKKQKSANLEETLLAMVELYIEKTDPLEKAKRQKIRGKLGPGPVKSTGVAKNNSESARSDSTLRPQLKKRQPIPAKIKHQLWLNSSGLCSHTDSNGRRCQQSRFLHVHHENPVATGGSNELSNLSLLCSGHHRAEHLLMTTI